MKAEFNDAMFIYTNDGSNGPGDFLGDTPARFVAYDQIEINSVSLSAVEAYATYIGGVLSAGTTVFAGGVVQVDTTTSIVVEFASNPGTFYFVRWCETVRPRVGGPYRRVHLQAS